MYRIIGNMTGNSMDAVDVVLTEFDGDSMRDVGAFSVPYDSRIQQDMESLRAQVGGKTRAQILALPDFRRIHDAYVESVATAVNQMCAHYHLDKQTIAAVGFHGKTLDHFPPSLARAQQRPPYTVQMGSGQMLADLTDIPVVYDFRSDYIMNNFEGAPLVGAHNAHIARQEGDGIYYNGGNTANFALVQGEKAVLASDVGPFNEYIDAYMRTFTPLTCDKDGQYGRQGQIVPQVIAALFDLVRPFYDSPLPKSGDPQIYRKADVFQLLKDADVSVPDAVRTLEYFAAYIAAQGLTQVKDIPLPPKVLLFGGGWHNPIVRQDFEGLLSGKGFILPEHTGAFATFVKSWTTPVDVRYSHFGTMMEARLFADMAYFRLTNRPWPTPETDAAQHPILSGIVAYPHQKTGDDLLSRATKA